VGPGFRRALYRHPLRAASRRRRSCPAANRNCRYGHLYLDSRGTYHPEIQAHAELANAASKTFVSTVAHPTERNTVGTVLSPWAVQGCRHLGSYCAGAHSGAVAPRRALS
jgi:hypothetical protein